MCPPKVREGAGWDVAVEGFGVSGGSPGLGAEGGLAG